MEKSGTSAVSPDLEGIEVFFAWVGPALAEELLTSYEIDYRKLRPKHADNLARDMSSNNWNFDGSPIRIDVNGNLLDGQHRLTAVKKSGIRLLFLFVTGLPVSVYSTIDTVLARRFADALRKDKYNNVTGRGALVNILDRWLTHKPLDLAYKLTHTELYAIHDKHVNGIDRAMELTVGIAKKTPMQTSLIAFSWWILLQIDEEKAHNFMTQFIHGESIKRTMPAFTIRTKFLNESDRRFNRQETLDMFFQAWNAFYVGNTLASVRYHSDVSRKNMVMPMGYEMPKEDNNVDA